MDIFQETLFRDLEKLNYTINESKIYLTLIKLGPSLAGNVSKEAQLDRSSTYNALKNLIQKGVVSTIHENQRTIFVPESPRKILDYFKEKEDVAKAIIPKLEEQFKFKKPKSTVKLYQGYRGLKTVFEDILKTCDEKTIYYIMGSEGFFSKSMPYYSPIFRKRKEEKKIKTKLLIRDGRVIKKKGKFTEYRAVPSDVVSPTTINVYGNKVAFFIWDRHPQAVLIENENVSKTFENYFNFMWKTAKKIDQP